MSTGFLWDERFAWHDAGMYPFPQMEPMPVLYNANAKRRIRNLIETSGLLQKLATVPFGEADDASVLRAHSPDYLARVRMPARAAWLLPIVIKRPSRRLRRRLG